MSFSSSEFRHVVLDDKGVAYVAGTTMNVRELVLEHVAYGWTAEQLQRQHSYLSMAQVHSALAYYFEHKALFEEEIERDLSSVENVQTGSATQSVLKKIKDSRHP